VNIYDKYKIWKNENKNKNTPFCNSSLTTELTYECNIEEKDM